jgi:predicted nucleic acid-binding protein
MIAATALDIGATLVTADPAFGAVKDLKTIWR